MNVISLEVSKSPLLRYITPPAAAQNLDLLNLAWPSKSHDDKGYPQVHAPVRSLLLFFWAHDVIRSSATVSRAQKVHTLTFTLISAVQASGTTWSRAARSVVRARVHVCCAVLLDFACYRCFLWYHRLLRTWSALKSGTAHKHRTRYGARFSVENKNSCFLTHLPPSASLVM